VNRRHFLEFFVPGFLSFFWHLAFFWVLFIWMNNRATTPLIELDLSKLHVSAAPASTSRPPEEEEWQKPLVPRKVVPPSPPPPKPEPPSPVVAVPAAPSTVNGTGGSGEFLSIAQVNRPPRPLNPAKPRYPEAAKRANIEGVVILQVDFDATGAVKKVEVIQGLGYGCEEEAIEWLQQTQWEPALDKNNQPAPAKMQIPIRFKFE
jgi:periplasmic protein TonB